MTAAHRNRSEGGAGLSVTKALGEARQRIVLGVEKSAGQSNVSIQVT